MPENNDHHQEPLQPQKNTIEPLEDRDIQQDTPDILDHTNTTDPLSELGDIDDLLENKKFGFTDGDTDSHASNVIAVDQATTHSAEALNNLQTQENVEEEQKNQTDLDKTKSSLLEKVAILCFLLIITGLGIYCYQYFNQKFDIKTEEDWVSNVPVKGEYANIESVKTWWAAPEKSRIGLKLVPTVAITLEPDSTSGHLKINFYSDELDSNNKPKPKGDPVYLKFENGKFTKSGKNTITFQCTDGFRDLGLFYQYKAQTEKRWTADIQESSMDKPDSHKDLAHAPITPDRAETTSAK